MFKKSKFFSILRHFSLLSILMIAFTSCSNTPEKTVHKEQTKSNDLGIKHVTIETDKGAIKAELYLEKAPITTKNFIDLINSGFYNGLTFHRVEAGFVVQGGDPKGDGTGGSGKTIPLEIIPELRHVRGALGMARTNDPNSATSQFYITLAETPFLDGQYAVFGKVISGMEIVEQIKVGDRMNKVWISDK